MPPRSSVSAESPSACIIWIACAERLSVRQTTTMGRGRVKTPISISEWRVAEFALRTCPGVFAQRIENKWGVLSPNNPEQGLHSEDLDHAFQVIGEDVQTHLRTDVFHRLGQEMRRPHPGL